MSIFSGDNSKDFWRAVNRDKDRPHKDWELLYKYGCKAQEIEAKLQSAEDKLAKIRAKAEYWKKVKGNSTIINCACNEAGQQILAILDSKEEKIDGT